MSTLKNLKLLDKISEIMRLRHYSIHTERAYCDWIKRYVRYHGMTYLKNTIIQDLTPYSGRFLDREEAVEYFNRYFPWYKKEHLHSGIDYVTPEQCHKGLKESIVSRRKENLKRQRYLRKEVNRLYQNTLTCNPENLIVNVNQFTACGVMIS